MISIHRRVGLKIRGGSKFSAESEGLSSDHIRIPWRTRLVVKPDQESRFSHDNHGERYQTKPMVAFQQQRWFANYAMDVDGQRRPKMGARFRHRVLSPRFAGQARSSSTTDRRPARCDHRMAVLWAWEGLHRLFGHSVFADRTGSLANHHHRSGRRPRSRHRTSLIYCLPRRSGRGTARQT